MTDKGSLGLDLAPRATGPDSGTRTINSLNVLDFTPNEGLEATISTSLIQQTGTFTAFAVVQYDSGTNGAFVFEGDTTNTSDRVGFRCVGSPGNLRYDAIDGTGSANAFDDGALDTSAHIITATSDGATAEIGLDGAARATDNTSLKSNTPNRIGLGFYPRASPAYYYNGAIGEVLIYSSQLSSSDIGTVETYLSDKWGITI